MPTTLQQPFPSDFSPPQRMDEFEVLHPLGRGGMGHVYLGHDTLLDRPVALKFIAGVPDLAQRGRFLIEARAIARLQHPHVAAIYRIGDVLGTPYIAYEFVDGTSLDRVSGPLSFALLLDVALGAARGLSAIHRSGVVHRDIKPGNLMRSSAGTTKLIDFGLAKLSPSARPALTHTPAPTQETAPTRPLIGAPPPAAKTSAPRVSEPSTLESDLAALRASLESGEALTGPGFVLGTPLYAAPELWNGVAANMRSDIYGLGLVLHELATGKPPRGTIPEGGQLFVPALYDPEPLALAAPELPELFGEIVDRCLTRDPALRITSGMELCDLLEDAARLLQLVGRHGARPSSPTRDVLVASLSRVEARVRSLGVSFYDRLFAARPELRSMFPARMEEQHMKLVGALQLSVEHLDKRERLTPLLEELGRRHAPYGVTPRDFDDVGRCLIDALRELEGSDFSPQTEDAWRSAYAEISGVMRRGMAGVVP